MQRRQHRIHDRGSVYYEFKGSFEFASVGFVEMAFEQSVMGCLTMTRQDVFPGLWCHVSNCPSGISWDIPEIS